MDAEPAAPTRRDGVLWFALYLVLALGTHCYVLLHAMPCDNSLYIRYARDWAAGERLYVDRYEQKTPVVFWLFRAIDSKNPRLSLYLGGALLAAAAASELRRGLVSIPQAAPVPGAIIVAWLGNAGFQHLYDAFLVPITLLVAAWLGRAVATRSTILYPTLAGMAFAIAVGIFPPMLACSLAWIPFLIWNARRNGWHVAVGGIAAFLVGGFIMCAAVASHAIAFGYWDAMLDAVAANRSYGAFDRISSSEHFTRWWEQISRLGDTGGTAVLVALAASIFGLLVRWLRFGVEVRVWAIAAVLWLLTAQLGAFVGGRHFSNYYVPLIAPLGILASLGFALFPDSPGLRSARRLLVAGFALVTVALYWNANYQAARDYKKKSPASDRTVIWLAAGYLDSQTPRDEPVLVCLWNQNAELYWRAARPSPSRHVIPWNLAESRPEYFAEWADDVLKNPPKWIVTDGLLVGPAVTDDSIRALSAGHGGRTLTDTPSFTRLRAFVRDEYEVASGVGSVIVLRRK